MSRSVESIGDNVFYFDCSELDEDDWENLVLNLRYDLKVKYPAFTVARDNESYPYREQQVIVENRFCRVSISEYSGCGAVSVYVRRDYGDYSDEPKDLAEHWILQVYNGIMEIVKKYVDVMYRVGGFSDGSSVYQLATPKDKPDALFADKRGEKL